MAYSFLDLAEDVLKSASAPLTYQQCWDQGQAKGLTTKVKTKGKTPWQTMGAQLYVDVRDNAHSRFVKVGRRPTRFFLKSRESELSEALLKRIEIEEVKKPAPKTTYHERDLHSLLTYYVYANPTFSRGRSIFTKTIFHEGSRRKGFNEWLHPDLVGVYLPLEDWKQDVIKFNQLLDNNSIRLFSFELKKSLSKSNYRESFFQAVSNSSWAHEGYLVAAEITQDDDLLAELERLSASFGIGIIHLHLSDFNSSTVVFPARARQILDWETINKLCEQNKDFAKFVQDVKIDFESERIHRSEYDVVIKEPEKYIKDKMKIEQDA
ncbi:MAG: HTH domain-containing protein [Phycisphaerae bacterium]